jgi:hypothetical protein
LRDLELALNPRVLDQLADLLDLSPTFGGIGTHSLKNSANEEFLGFFAAIASPLISICRNTNEPVYIRIAEALEELDAPQPVVSLCTTVEKVREVRDILHSQEADITNEELVSAS